MTGGITAREAMNKSSIYMLRHFKETALATLDFQPDTGHRDEDAKHGSAIPIPLHCALAWSVTL